MSLIHDALKKIESTDNPPSDIPPHLQPDETTEIKPKKNMRIVILVVVFVCVAAYFLYQKIYVTRLTQTAANAARTDVAITGQIAGSQAKVAEATQLKGEAARSFKSGNLEDAWLRLSTASQINPADYELWNDMGVVSKRKGDPIKAREYFDRALQLKADYPECLNNLAVLDMEEGNFEMALEKLNKAITTKADYAEALFNIAIVSEHNGKIREAVDYYERFLSVARDAPIQILDDVRNHIADIAVE